ncbi:MAG: acylphosphatase [Fibrobacterota bacterium]|nr:acylphosphatase [Chitinispirillaceae bacterium]
MVKRVSLVVSGRVQSVGFRYFTRDIASEMNLTGFVRNAEDGRVEIEVQGDSELLETFVEKIRVGPQLSKVTSYTTNDLGIVENESEFIVKH